MKIGVLLFIISDVKDYLVAANCLDADGTIRLDDVNVDTGLASVIDNSLKRHGVDIPDQVDRIISALPFLIGIFIH